MNAHHLINNSFHFIRTPEIMENALAFSLHRRNDRALEYLAKKHNRPTSVDRIKNYIKAIV